jgi:hypothetical protein
MWIHFDFICEREKQIMLHRSFRKSVTQWKDEGIITGAIMTYHFNTPRKPSDSLYLCLDFPSLKPQEKRSRKISEETISKIPHSILDTIRKKAKAYDIQVDFPEDEPPIDRLVLKDYVRARA